MNRRVRRATQGHSDRGKAPAELAQAASLAERGRTDEAIRAYKRALRDSPDNAQAWNNLAILLQGQGKLADAGAAFARSVALMPQLLDAFSGVAELLRSLNPALAAPSADLDAMAADPLLTAVLQTAPVRDLSLEHLLTAARARLLLTVDERLALRCAFARQCFINEYVWATTAEEAARVDTLKANVATASAADLATLAMYLPLHTLPGADELPARQWPAAFDAVLAQQIREPQAERALRDAMPGLTSIDDAVSQRVRAQYEDNPYPRWTRIAGGVEPVAIDDYLRGLFPTAPLTPLGDRDPLDILVAGCGTGWQSTTLAQKFAHAKILAIDLSLASLAYAKRNTPDWLAPQIEYAQADILKLGGLSRQFDVIDASGVLHHMADPLEGWRILLGLLKPGGVMHVALYSELGRQDIVAGRDFIAKGGYGSSPADIRRARQDLIATPLRSLARVNDFFSTSECRDMLFHVQETRTSIPAIKQFITAQGLRFLGFEFGEATQQQLRALFSQSGWLFGDLERWHTLEQRQPGLFAGMYHFWLQKP